MFLPLMLQHNPLMSTASHYVPSNHNEHAHLYLLVLAAEVIRLADATMLVLHLNRNSKHSNNATSQRGNP